MSNATSIELPQKFYFRRGEVRDIFGFSEEEMTKLIRAGTLQARVLPGSKRAHFARQDLLKLIPQVLTPVSLTGNGSTPPATHASVPKTATRPGTNKAMGK